MGDLLLLEQGSGMRITTAWAADFSAGDERALHRWESSALRIGVSSPLVMMTGTMGR